MTATGPRYVEVAAMTDEALETLNVDASTDFVLGTGNEVTVPNIDATGSTYSVTLNLGAADHTVTGGDADDIFNFGPNSTADDVIVGNGGLDTMNMTVASGVT